MWQMRQRKVLPLRKQSSKLPTDEEKDTSYEDRKSGKWNTNQQCFGVNVIKQRKKEMKERKKNEKIV
jgi:hypothetical protein